MTTAAFSGDSLACPGLQKLLADIREHRVDIFVVSQVERLTPVAHRLRVARGAI